MVRALYRTQDGDVRTDVTTAELAEAMQDVQGLLWVDLSGTAEACEPILRETFGFHPLAVEDALQESHVPKVDDWETYLYVVLHAVDLQDQEGSLVETPELDVFLGKNYIVTYHDDPIAAVDEVWADCQQDRRFLEKGADHVLYQLAGALVGSYESAVEQIEEGIVRVERQVFQHPDPALLERIFALKRALLRLARTISPQREALNTLAREKYSVIDRRDRVFFRDVHDHLVRLYDIIESLRDLVGDTQATYLSVVNNRMGDVMKTLNVIIALFMPMSFLASFFGMNLFQTVAPLDIWGTRWAGVLTLAVVVLTPLTMYLWLRRRALT